MNHHGRAGKPFDEIDRLNEALIRSYLDIIKFFSKRSGREGPVSLAAVPACLGKENLFASFSSVVPPIQLSGRPMEWNPLSQRPPSHLMGFLEHKVKPYLRYEHLEKLIHSFIFLTHEMVHVLTWEPFFTGHLTVPDAATFAEFNLLAEGFCLFHSEVLVSPMVKTRFPDGEFVTRRKVISANFNVQKAFHAIGLKKNEDILDVFLKALGGESSILLSPKSSVGFGLAHMLYGYRNVSADVILDLYRQLRSFDIFSEFHSRFCAHENMPSLLPNRVLARASGHDFENYFRDLFRSGLKDIDELPAKAVQRVKLRRAIQVRAYFAYQMRHLLKNGMTSNVTLSRSRLLELLNSLNRYIDLLENNLTSLIKGDSSLVHHKALLSADQDYERSIRRPLGALRAWVGQRDILNCVYTYDQSFRGLKVGVTDARQRRLSSREVRRALVFLLSEHQRRLLASRSQTQRAKILDAVRDIVALEKKIPQRAKPLSVGLASAFVKVLQDEANLPLWSVPLAMVDPLRNQFVELSFVFE